MIIIFGGYAKYSEELILFMREFYKITGLYDRSNLFWEDVFCFSRST